MEHDRGRRAAVWVLAVGLLAGAGPAARAEVDVRELPARLHAARSVRVVSNRYFQSREPGVYVAVPFEVVYERPGKYRAVLELWNCVPPFEATYEVSDGERYLLYAEHTRKARTGRLGPLEAELTVERYAQSMIGQLVGLTATTDGYVRQGVEDVGGRPAERFERRLGAAWRYVLWLDRDTGLPLRAASYLSTTGDGSAEQLMFEATKIDVSDAPLPPETFALAPPPPGYAVTQQDRTAAADAGNLNDRDAECWCRFALDLGGGAVLLGWWASSPAGEPDLGGPVGRRLAFPVSMGEAAGWRLYHLRDDAAAAPKGRHLRWTLAVAADPAAAARDRAFALGPVPGGKGRTTVLWPQQFADERLRTLVEQVQRLTAADGAHVFPLDELRALAGKLRTGH